MTAVSGINLRSGEAYWELSGPISINRVSTCRCCRKTINKGSIVMVRDGRKLRFFYHAGCFTGDADPRTQENSSYTGNEHIEYHHNTAPNISSLEGPKAYKDPDGRPLGRAVFKTEAPSVLGHGKWSVNQRGGTRMLRFLVVYDDDADGADDTDDDDDDDDDVDFIYDNIIYTMMFHRMSLRYLYNTHIRSDHMILLMLTSLYSSHALIHDLYLYNGITCLPSRRISSEFGNCTKFNSHIKKLHQDRRY